MKWFKHMDAGSMIVMALTFILFAGGAFTKGVTHDLLLEAGVFLVSLKLIIMSFKNSVASAAIRKDLLEIKGMISDWSAKNHHCREVEEHRSTE